MNMKCNLKVVYGEVFDNLILLKKPQVPFGGIAKPITIPICCICFSFLQNIL